MQHQAKQRARSTARGAHEGAGPITVPGADGRRQPAQHRGAVIAITDGRVQLVEARFFGGKDVLKKFEIGACRHRNVALMKSSAWRAASVGSASMARQMLRSALVGLPGTTNISAVTQPS